MVGIEPQIEKLSPGVLVMGKGRLWFVVVQGNYEYEFLNGKRRKLPFIKQILKADARR